MYFSVPAERHEIPDFTLGKSKNSIFTIDNQGIPVTHASLARFLVYPFIAFCNFKEILQTYFCD